MANGRGCDETVHSRSLPPRCRHCDGILRDRRRLVRRRPQPADIIAAADARRASDVFLIIGTSSIVYPAAGLVHQAKRHGAMTVEINAEATEATGVVDIALRGGAEEILPALASALKSRPAI